MRLSIAEFCLVFIVVLFGFILGPKSHHITTKLLNDYSNFQSDIRISVMFRDASLSNRMSYFILFIYNKLTRIISPHVLFLLSLMSNIITAK
jgi:hypothetical protein